MKSTLHRLLARPTLALGLLSAALATPLPAEPSPLPLGEAISIALRDSPRIRNACDELRSTRYGLEIAEADFRVQLVPQAASGLATDTETSQSSVFTLSKKFTTGTIVDLSAGTAVTQDDFYRSFSGVTISQAVFRGFGSLTHTARLADAERRIQSARRSLRFVEEAVVMEVIEAFYQLIGQESVLSILRASLDRAKHHLEASEARLARGLATRMDLYRAESQLASSEGALLEAEDQLQAARDTLKLLLALDLGDPIEVAAGVTDVSLESAEAELLAEALERRIDLQEAADLVRDAERGHQIASRSLYPDLRLGVNFALIGRGDSFDESTSLRDSGARFLVSGSNPLDWSAERAQAEQARLEVVRRKRELAQLRDRVTLEVRRALQHLATTDRRLGAHERSLEATRASHELAALRFERGYAEMEELLSAEESLAQAELSDVRLRIERTLGWLRLRRTAGLLHSWIDSIASSSAKLDRCS